MRRLYKGQHAVVVCSVRGHIIRYKKTEDALSEVVGNGSRGGTVHEGITVYRLRWHEGRDKARRGDMT